MIPKHKLAILLGVPTRGAPKEEPGHEEGDGASYQEELDRCVDELADAIVSGKREAIVSALHGLHDCMVEEDEEKDAEAKEED